MRLSWLSLAFAIGLAWTTVGSSVHAEEMVTPKPSIAAKESAVSVDQLPARQAVREGNRQLRGGDPAAALEAYARAQELRPDAPEIPFVEGLAQYALKEYDAARDAFKNAATGRNRKLANDALYSVGTAYHAEALASLQNPQQAIGKLESAMQRYREVLANQPDHEAARDSNFKAASMRRQLIQMLERQQQQEQNESCDNPGEDQDEQDKQEQQQQNEKQDQEEQPAGQQQDEKQEQQEESPPQPQPSDEEQEEEEQLQQQQESAEEQEERVSREQAERRLREMVQAMREREEQRRQRVQQIPVAPVEKDW